MSDNNHSLPGDTHTRRGYRNAAACLPPALLQELQRYAGGETLYIPAPADQRRGWGERSGLRAELSARNVEIRNLYREGTSIDELAHRYGLSIERIRRICYSRNQHG